MLAVVWVWLNRKKKTKPSLSLAAFSCGGFAGVVGGLFSTAGPPNFVFDDRQPVL